MHKLRNAVIAGAAAVALTLGGTAVAGAEETVEDNGSFSAPSFGSSGGSSALGDNTEADDRGTGEDALGEEIDEEATPEWLGIWRDLTTVAGVGTILGAIVGIFNFFQFLNA